uniref:Uncharacterized protein n=1 Tax=Cyanothece sp. (strain PCC 7425 / ATCC 29141) TaxID=395961 RepID=B8HW02_CYAP4
MIALQKLQYFNDVLLLLNHYRLGVSAKGLVC